ncbi:MAG: hypothetical protein RLZZ221_399 [Verrucomicrobiota bacterium]
MYFAAPRAPITEPVLLRDGERSGLVNNAAVMSNVSPTYAPAGQALIATTLIGTAAGPADQLVGVIRAQMTEWFGPQAGDRKLLRTYRIAYAQQDQRPPALNPAVRAVRIKPGLYVSGDHRENGSINGAIAAGRRAAAPPRPALLTRADRRPTTNHQPLTTDNHADSAI